MISLGFGDMMKEYRKKHNLKQTELAEMSSSERKEYAMLLGCLDGMEPKKREQAMDAIIRLLKLV